MTFGGGDNHYEKNFSLIICLFLLIFACSCGQVNDITKQTLSSLEKEYSGNIAGALFGKTIYYNDERIYLDYVIKKHQEHKSLSTVAYAIYDQDIYFSYIYEKTDKDKLPYNWVLARYNIETETMQTIYESQSNSSYHERLFRENGKIGGQLIQDKIYLVNGTECILYSICKDEITVLESGDFSLLKNYGLQSCVGGYIVTDTDDVKYTITYSEMVSKSSAAKKLSGLIEEKIWNGATPIDKKITFLQPEEQAFFIVDTILNRNGSSYAVVYAYNKIDASYQYINYYYVDDLVESVFYVVPVVASS